MTCHETRTTAHRGGELQVSFGLGKCVRMVLEVNGVVLVSFDLTFEGAIPVSNLSRGGTVNIAGPQSIYDLV